ncbi:PPK2 family polyphosphate kinase [Nocardioides sp. Kera G14]|uniref:PPK2 family polyphosphate kinase n=1 Tax=Nocardioides sp. Kera G14 TaxID=2884264 RepID=UPI001D124781|nr:PPK2 family polyphosphate kinase [Nocardioides sp. Kera G14]UDY25362.1 polyphosphate kinase 2 family protein [Nocardioides sp. Kera G14]
MGLADALRVPPGPVDLSEWDPAATPAVKGGRKEAEGELFSMADELLELQTKLLASKEGDSPRGLLLVLQGMDTSGKGGVLKHSVGLMDPVGLKVTSFKAPTEEERSHDFLWRVESAVPPAGFVGFFDRSHYEDVLIQKVRSFAPAEEIERRYGAINDFEKRLVDQGIVVLKCMLHISPEAQKERLLERLEDPTKHWKYNPGDVDERQLWAEYTKAYEIALERCNTEPAPWFIVPSDKKWYRNLAIAKLLRDHLAALDLDWTTPSGLDIAAEKARLAADTITSESVQ